MKKLRKEKGKVKKGYRMKKLDKKDERWKRNIVIYIKEIESVDR